MKYGGNNNSQGSPGFVYFDNSPATNSSGPPPSGSPGYMNFNSSPGGYMNFNNSPRNNFTPEHFSSPQGNNRYNPKWGRNRGNYRFNGGYNNRRSMNNCSGSSNSSFNNSSQNSSYCKSKDPKSFLHPSFTEDPWAELEKQAVEEESTVEEGRSS